MNVNGVTSVGDSYAAYTKEAVKDTEVNKASEVKAFDDKAAVYEPTLEIPTQTYKVNSEVITKLKADADARYNQLQDIVSQLISKQSNAFATATDMWNLLREGKLEVDPETKAQAQKDIAEDGYWGVDATSQRIIDCANALTGGDPSKIDAMKDAFLKGFKQAEKTWGGKLPEISQRTYDAVLEKFDQLKADAGLESQT